MYVFFKKPDVVGLICDVLAQIALGLGTYIRICIIHNIKLYSTMFSKIVTCDRKLVLGTTVC